MSERQEDKREQERVRRLAEFSRLWQGVDPAAIERRYELFEKSLKKAS
jgi:hypothetical protein